jgi:hypothetical protein
LLANTNLDDGKGAKTRALENVESMYLQALKNIYNSNTEEIKLEEDPFFAAMKIPGKDINPEESVPDATVPDSTTEEQQTIEVDQM